MEGFARERDNLQFSHCDRWIGGTNLSRLNRFYVSDWLGARGGSIGILASTSMSEHAPEILAIVEERHNVA